MPDHLSSKPKLYALFINIEYWKNRHISDLVGTARDVEQLQLALEKHFGARYNLHFSTLSGEKATRSNIIQQSLRHLGQAEEGDTALLYYSGHGSTELAAPEFQTFAADGRSEGLVAYDSFYENTPLLADKELAVLLQHIGRKGAELLLLLDCCHSGSMSKGEGDEVARFVPRLNNPEDELPRAFDSYLSDAILLDLAQEQEELTSLYQYYQQQKQLSIPDSAHILLSACASREVAWGNTAGGRFTQALIKVLEQQRAPLSYNELQLLLKIELREKRSALYRQSPQLELYGGRHGQESFLGGDTVQHSDWRQVYCDNKGLWHLALGAQDAVVWEAGPRRLFLYDSPQASEPLGDFEIGQLGLSTSRLRARWPKEKAVLAGLNPQRIYWARVQGQLKQYPLYCRLAEKQRAFLQQSLDKAAPLLCLAGDENSRFRVVEHADGLAVYEQESDELLCRSALNNEKDGLRLAYYLDDLRRWEYVRALEASASPFGSADWELHFQLLDGSGEVKESSDKSYWEISYKGHPVNYDWALKNTSGKDFYAAVLVLTQDYGIHSLRYSEKVPSGRGLQLIHPGDGALEMEEGLDSERFYFKCFISKSPLDRLATLVRPGKSIGDLLGDEAQRSPEQTPLEKGIRSRPEPAADWQCLTLEVVLKR